VEHVPPLTAFEAARYIVAIATRLATPRFLSALATRGATPAA
jgi:hypothetical protein